MNYHCNTPFEGGKCPVCGSLRVRPVEEEDLCLAASGSAIQMDMLGQMLEEEGLPFLKQSQIGAAMAMLTGRQTEQFDLLVPYRCFDRAREIADGFAAQAPVEIPEDVLFEDEDYEGEREEEDDEYE